MMSMVFTSSTLAQDLLYEVPLSEQVEVSSQIVEGKVISKNSFWDVNQQQIYTVNTVEVYKVFKGEALSTIEVVTLGGRVGDVGLMVTPSLVLQKDDVGLFLLQDSDVELTSSSVVPRYKSNSSVQGFFKYNIYDNLATSPFSIKNGITSELYNDITELTNSTYTSVSSFNIDNQIDFLNAQRAAGGIAINSFSPTTISGGTKSILTIEGAGFGTTPGAVLFRDANDGGASLYPALDSQIISWTNTQIQVEVPSRAGTGTIRVVDPIGFNVTSSTPLTIAFSEINYSDGVNAFQTQHIDQNSNGGYTWSMHIEFNNNSAAAAAFNRAFDTWVCETGVNWDIGGITATDTVASDGINVIRFDNGSELASGTLGVCSSWIAFCGSAAFIGELDIVFNDTTNWQYGPSAPSAAQIDFESVAVHELGHGHQMAHVIDTNAIMHYSIGNGISNRVLSANDIAGGNDVQSRSTTTAVCGQGLMTNSECSLSVDEHFLSENISIFPNPANDKINIKNASSINLQKAVIYDVRGSVVSSIDFNQSSSLKTINVSSLTSGVYFINIYSDRGSVIEKFMVE